MQSTQYTTNDFIKDCQLFNTIAGKDGVPTKKALLEQIELIQEELNETKRDLLAGNYTGLLDGYVDVMVTSAGLGQMLDALQMDTLGAMKATAANNLTKFVNTSDVDTCIDTLNMYADKGVGIIYEQNPRYELVVFKDINNKVRKPSNFVSNDVSSFVPLGLIIKEGDDE